MKPCRYAPLEHPLVQQFQRAIDSLTAALAPASVRQYRAVARCGRFAVGGGHKRIDRRPRVLLRDWTSLDGKRSRAMLEVAAYSLILSRAPSTGRAAPSNGITESGSLATLAYHARPAIWAVCGLGGRQREPSGTTRSRDRRARL